MLEDIGVHEGAVDEKIGGFPWRLDLRSSPASRRFYGGVSDSVIWRVIGRHDVGGL